MLLIGMKCLFVKRRKSAILHRRALNFANQQVIAGVLRNLASCLCSLPTLSHSLRLTLAGYFCCCNFCESIERQLDICHVVAQIFFRQSLVPFVLARSHTPPRLG